MSILQGTSGKIVGVEIKGRGYHYDHKQEYKKYGHPSDRSLEGNYSSMIS